MAAADGPWIGMKDQTEGAPTALTLGEWARADGQPVGLHNWLAGPRQNGFPDASGTPYCVQMRTSDGIYTHHACALVSSYVCELVAPPPPPPPTALGRACSVGDMGAAVWTGGAVDKCFVGFKTSATHAQAAAGCAALGNASAGLSGHLFLPGSEREVQYLLYHLNLTGVADAWVAPSDSQTENVFVRGSDSKLAGFYPWRIEQPNNLQGNQDCASFDGIFWYGDTWGDWPCLNIVPAYICELSASAPPPPPSTPVGAACTSGTAGNVVWTGGAVEKCFMGFSASLSGTAVCARAHPLL